MPIFGTTSPSCPPPPPQFAQTAPFSPHSHTLLSIEATFIAAPLNAFCWRPRPENKETKKKNPKQHKRTPKSPPPPPPQKPQNGGISPQNGAHLPCNAIQVPLPLRGQFASAAKKDHFCAQNAPKMGEMNPKWDGGGLKGAPSLFCAQNAPKMGEMNSKWGWGGRGGFLKGPRPFLCSKCHKTGRNEPKMGMGGEGLKGAPSPFCAQNTPKKWEK